jgi:Flp pilus assembly protein CpaB
MRALTLRIDPAHAPSPLPKLNDRVDVVGVLSVQGGPAKPYTLAQGLRCLAVSAPAAPATDRRAAAQRTPRPEPARRAFRSVTLEVAPRTAEELTALIPRLSGPLWVVVRKPVDASRKFTGLNPEVRPALTAPLPKRPDPAARR